MIALRSLPLRYLLCIAERHDIRSSVSKISVSKIIRWHISISRISSFCPATVAYRRNKVFTWLCRLSSVSAGELVEVAVGNVGKELIFGTCLPSLWKVRHWSKVFLVCFCLNICSFLQSRGSLREIASEVACRYTTT